MNIDNNFNIPLTKIENGKWLNPLNENVKFFEKVMSGKFRHCSKCGCGYMAYQEYTYRDNCGRTKHEYSSNNKYYN